MITCPACGHEAETPFKFCPECGAPAEAPARARGQRKVVTVLFCDITGSTALGERVDPEPLRALLARYFGRMRSIVEAHGGTVEKFIGDAVMAVFGVPVLHEDDALRAVRAAIEMRDALPELGIQGRIGVTTGEVVTGTEERLATGDAVNVAARLEQAADPGENLVGAETLRLVRPSVEVEAVEPLELTGKRKLVAAFRLPAVAPVLGGSDVAATAEDIAWGFGKTLEEAAAGGPVVCVLDDLHWAEPALLDLVEHVADWSRNTPILLLCMARPELLDKREGWA